MVKEGKKASPKRGGNAPAAGGGKPRGAQPIAHFARLTRLTRARLQATAHPRAANQSRRGNRARPPTLTR